MTRWQLVTSEYPPDTGGVSDYSRLVAHGLAELGDEVIVWCPGREVAPRLEAEGRIRVRATLGGFGPSDLRRVGRLMDAEPSPRLLLVQWVPHGFRLRAVNVPFAIWLWRRVRSRGDRLELMVHEGGLPYSRVKLRQNLAAVAQRAMVAITLNVASRVWISNPRWEKRLRPFSLGRKLRFTWLPVPSNVPEASDADAIKRVRDAVALAGQPVVGHFGTYAEHTTRYLDALAESVTAAGAVLLLMGVGSKQYAKALAERLPTVGKSVFGRGALDATALSAHLSACDVVAQPYPDGVSGRRGSAMAALAHGRAMVTTRGEFTEPVWLVDHPVRAVAAGDPAVFAKAVLETLRDGSERCRLEIAARRLYTDHFDLAHTISALRRNRGTDASHP